MAGTRKRRDEQERVVDDATVLSEYAEATDLIQGVREASDHGAEERVRHWSVAAGKISADFFCAAEHPKLGWFCLMADTAGHGLASAIFSLHLPMLFRESVLLGMSLPAIHTRIHRFLLRQNVASYYVCGILVHVDGRQVEVLNAGMPDALLLASDGRLCEAFPSLSVPFGIDKNLKPGDEELVRTQRYRLSRHEVASLLLYSDGLSELGILGGAAFGSDGVLATAVSGADQLFDRLVDRINANFHAVHDDITLALVSLPLPAGHAHGHEHAAGSLGEERSTARPRESNASVTAALAVLENTDHGYLLTDREQQILYVNPAFTTITGYSAAEAVGQTPRMLHSGRQGADFYRRMWSALENTGCWQGEIWNRRKDGSVYLEWLEVHAFKDALGQVDRYLATFTRLEHKQDQEERLHFLALHDSLTGLANRILLNDRGLLAIRQSDRTACSLAVLFIDLDRFKAINESLGHDMGDEVLAMVAHRFSSALRGVDTLARFGGDEFVCLLPNIVSRQDIMLVAAKLLAVLDMPVEIEGHRCKVTASIGVSTYPSDGQHFDDLIVNADRAMYQAKQAGGNLVRFFCAEMAVAVERQLEMEVRLDAAVKNGELELHYQPKIDLSGNRIVGAEALVRWRDGARGWIPPGEFIPVAEKGDLIARIGNWVMQEACRVLARHSQHLPLDFHLAINVSPLQFERCDLADELRRAIHENGVHAHQLQIEVTESLLIQNPDRTGDTLRRIAQMGISIALDDFGTGYSNLGLLSRLPFDTFKLDQSFVRRLHMDPAKAAIVRSIWRLGSDLGKKLVAEGVESCEECIRLMEIGYCHAQGFLYARPMPEREFFNFLKAWDPEQRCACPHRKTTVAAQVA